MVVHSQAMEAAYAAARNRDLTRARRLFGAAILELPQHVDLFTDLGRVIDLQRRKLESTDPERPLLLASAYEALDLARCMGCPRAHKYLNRTGSDLAARASADPLTIAMRQLRTGEHVEAARALCQTVTNVSVDVPTTDTPDDFVQFLRKAWVLFRVCGVVKLRGVFSHAVQETLNIIRSATLARLEFSETHKGTICARPIR